MPRAPIQIALFLRLLIILTIPVLLFLLLLIVISFAPLLLTILTILALRLPHLPSLIVLLLLPIILHLVIRLFLRPPPRMSHLVLLHHPNAHLLLHRFLLVVLLIVLFQIFMTRFHLILPLLMLLLFLPLLILLLPLLMLTLILILHPHTLNIRISILLSLMKLRCIHLRNLNLILSTGCLPLILLHPIIMTLITMILFLRLIPCLLNRFPLMVLLPYPITTRLKIMFILFHLFASRVLFTCASWHSARRLFWH